MCGRDGRDGRNGRNVNGKGGGTNKVCRLQVLHVQLINQEKHLNN